MFTQRMKSKFIFYTFQQENIHSYRDILDTWSVIDWQPQIWELITKYLITQLTQHTRYDKEQKPNFQKMVRYSTSIIHANTNLDLSLHFLSALRTSTRRNLLKYDDMYTQKKKVFTIIQQNWEVYQKVRIIFYMLLLNS